MRITPAVATGAQFTTLNPDLPTRPDYLVDHAVSTALSPDGATLLVLTSGYNRNNNPTGQRIAAESNEYVFVYDVRGGHPVKQQVLQVPNTFSGIAWNPRGDEFYVAGGVDDNVHVFVRSGDLWSKLAAPIALGHNNAGLGPGVRPLASGLGVNAAGTRLLVANYENDSVSLVDLASRTKLAELDLRPGKTDPGKAGVPGGEYPFWVVWKGDGKAYVSSLRDREIVVLGVTGDVPTVQGRIKITGQPNKMILDRAGGRLYAAVDNSDTVAVIDTETDKRAGGVQGLGPEVGVPQAGQAARRQPQRPGAVPRRAHAVRDQRRPERGGGGGAGPAGQEPGDRSAADGVVSQRGQRQRGRPHAVRGERQEQRRAQPRSLPGHPVHRPRIVEHVQRQEPVRLAAAQGRLPVAAAAAAARAGPSDLAGGLQQQVPRDQGTPGQAEDDGVPARADQTRDLRGEGEPHLRPGPRRPAPGQRRSVAGHPVALQPEPPGAGQPVRHPGQLPRQRRDLEHRLELDHRRAFHRLHREDRRR